MLNAPPVIDSEKRRNISPRPEPPSKRGYERFRKHSLFDMTMIIVSFLTPSFIEFRKKEIDGLLETEVFSIVKDISQNTRIFSSRFVNDIKHKNTSKAYEKSRLVI